jgi:hypothetical protein
VSEETEIAIPAATVMNVMTLTAALPTAVVTLGFGLYLLIFSDAISSTSSSQATLAAIAAIGVSTWLGARGFGALLRALARRPMLIANLEGLKFDPTLCREAVPWSEVRRIHDTGWNQPYKLTFDLRRRIWAVESPLGAQRVRISALYLGGQGWIPSDLIDRLERLRLRASHDPDAGG